MKEGALTLLELVAVIMVIGILVAVALPNFAPMTEKVREREAAASLRLIKAAQKIYRMEIGFYFPEVSYSGTINNNDISANLKLVLPDSGLASRAWDYTSKSYLGATAGGNCAQATRFNGPVKTWRLQMDEADPVASTCP